MNNYNKIFAFIKFFEKQIYAQEFIEGKIYANKLSYFKKVEGSTGVKMDKYEGTCAIFQSKQSTLKLNGGVIDTVGNITLSRKKDEYKNIFCMYTLIMPNGVYKDTKDIKNQLMILSKCEELGKYAVIVRANEFLEKIKAVELKQFKINKIRMGEVNYYDENTFQGSFDDDNVLFNKIKKFEYQKEYRLVIDSEVNNELILKIGSIKDITTFCKIKDINKGLEVTVDGNNNIKIEYKIEDMK
jgi:hypothetical protein